MRRRWRLAAYEGWSYEGGEGEEMPAEFLTAGWALYPSLLPFL